MGNVPRTRTVRIRATEQEKAGKPHTRTLYSQSEMHQRNGETDRGGPAILLEKERQESSFSFLGVGDLGKQVQASQETWRSALSTWSHQDSIGLGFWQNWQSTCRTTEGSLR